MWCQFLDFSLDILKATKHKFIMNEDTLNSE